MSTKCSICPVSAERHCEGCKNNFCQFDFTKHKQQLFEEFNKEIVEFHFELLDKLKQLEKPRSLSLNVFAEIEKWEKETIDKVRMATEKVRSGLTQLIDKQREAMRKQLKSIKIEIDSHQNDGKFNEIDIHQLKQKIDKIQETLRQFIEKDANKAVIVVNDKIDWNRRIYVQEDLESEIDGNLRPGADVRPNRLGQRFSDVGSSSSPSPRSSVQIRANQSVVSQQRGQHDMEATKEEDIAMSKDFTDGVKPGEIIEKPWKFNENRPDIKPMPIKGSYTDYDYWDEDHVRMPCSKHYAYKNGQLIWPIISQHLTSLQKKCENHTVKFKDLKSPPLLKIATNRSVTMSQEQAAALLACAFFCLFPYRSYPSPTKEYEHFQDPNFETLYRDVRQNKLEKLKCILHYFNRVTENMPNGVITFQRVSLPKDRFPSWRELNIGLCDLSMTTGKKIEDIKNVLQVDFANKYIGGGVLGGGCVQEEIRFTICPEMLVSLLVCEVMDKNECIFLIGCERYSSYKGYADSFEYAGDYRDNTPRDGWGRKWCHVIAMDAVYFRNPSDQYDMKLVERELLKAYTGFRPREDEADYKFGIATGNWGCGAFHGDKQLKGIG
ncbi:unnamed protein product [Rotaria sp. Silwood2]|nr:unnamed protein product [Rotaria sp. Silwood2]